MDKKCQEYKTNMFESTMCLANYFLKLFLDCHYPRISMFVSSTIDHRHSLLNSQQYKYTYKFVTIENESIFF